MSQVEDSQAGNSGCDQILPSLNGMMEFYVIIVLL